MTTFLFDHRVAIGIVLVLAVVAFILLGLIQDRLSKRAQRYPDEQRGRRSGGSRQVFPPHARDDSDAVDAARRSDPSRAAAGQKPRDDLRPDAAAWRDAVRPVLPAPRGTADDAEIRAELAKLTEQVGTLADRLTSGFERVDRRFEQLELRVDGQTEASSYGNASTYGREVDSMFASRPQYDPLATSGAASDGVVSQPIGFGSDASFGDTGGGRIAVELNGTEATPSSTIPPDAWLTPRGDGKAAVSLDPGVHYHKFALDRFATFFDLGDRREGTYVTRLPAEVRWDEREQRGVLSTPGKAVAR